MMRRFISLLIVMVVMAGCGTDATPASDGSQEAGASRVVEQYLTLLVNRDEAGFLQTLCPSYEGDGMNEFRSFASVDGSLKNMTCASDGREGDVVFVICTGMIELVYQGADTLELDLSREVYRTSQEDGEWKVCGKGRNA